MSSQPQAVTETCGSVNVFRNKKNYPPPTAYESVPKDNSPKKPLLTRRRSYITMITIHHLCTPIGKVQLHLLPNDPLTPASNNIHPGRNNWTTVCNSLGPKRKLEPYLFTNWWNESTKIIVRQNTGIYHIRNHHFALQLRNNNCTFLLQKALMSNIRCLSIWWFWRMTTE